MKILFYSPAFYPSIGGLETITSILAHEFIRKGYQVKLVSQIPSTDSKRFPFEVIRRPSHFKLLSLVRWCDVYFQLNISLKGLWPLALIRRPWIVSHQGWYARLDGSLRWQDKLKHFATGFATNVALSQAGSNHLSVPCELIPNTYEDELFYEMSEIPRNKDLVFLGRLVSDKGCNLLISSLTKIKQKGFEPKLTIIGGGPEEANLRKQIKECKLESQVDFAGIETGKELAVLLNSHRIMVVPSIWNEPFGIVALEGIACGCVVVGSEGGGLKEAIGPCGLTFPNGNLEALTVCLMDLLLEPSKLERFRIEAQEHLSRHKPAKITEAYLQVMKEALQNKSK